MGRRNSVLGVLMFRNNKSFDKKCQRMILVGAAVLIAASVSAGGVAAFDWMLELGQEESAPIASSNELAP